MLDTAIVQNKFVEINNTALQLYAGNVALWNDVLDNVEYISVEYTRASLDYQYAYMTCFVKHIVDLSVIIFHNDKAIGLWPVSLLCRDEEWAFATNEGEVLAPLYISGVSEKIAKKYNEICFRAIKYLYEYVKKSKNISKKWGGRHNFFNNTMTENAVIWYRKCMEHGAVLQTVNDLYIDLSLPENKYYSGIRKSYKSLIHEGSRLWKVRLLKDGLSEEDFEVFRLFHIQVAGRITRSEETWELQRQAMASSNMFIVAIYDESDTMVGYGMFSITRDEGVYAIGVYDRTLFDKPLGHLIQWEAIRYMRQLGLRWYKIGKRFYTGDTLAPTDKEVSIAYYKEGFATNLFVNLISTNDISKT